MDSLASFQEWTRRHAALIREDFFRFLRFRTISADPSCKGEMEKCVEWLKGYFQHTGLSAEKIETSGYPIVYAENLEAGKNAPTLLIYGHYDVQPVDPVELWKSDPFEPEERGGEVYARGAVDDKGQILFAVLALRMWKELGRRLPINVKFCIEGEEESGSVGLAKSLSKIAGKIRADYLLVADCAMIDRKTAAITLGCRGIVTMEVKLTGSKTDLHSGMTGGIAYNPNRALVELLASLWDNEGRVTVPHFYDGVQEMREAERKQFSFPFDKDHFAKEFGIEAIGGEKGRTLQEKKWLRPTMEINGISGGYAGPGFKTVIPAQAVAKLSCRLVPHQDPATIGQRVAEFLKKHAKKGMKIEVAVDPGGLPFRSNPDSKLARALADAYTEVMGTPCKKILGGGSLPVIADLTKAAKAEVVGMGYSLPDDGLHAPNEHFGLDRLEKGIWTVARTMELLGEKS